MHLCPVETRGRQNQDAMGRKGRPGQRASRIPASADGTLAVGESQRPVGLCHQTRRRHGTENDGRKDPRPLRCRIQSLFSKYCI